MKRCRVCGGALPPRKSKYCTRDCEKVVRNSDAMKVRVDKGDTSVGVGKGGSNLQGEAHKQFGSGMGQFYKMRAKMRETILNCNRCDKDLTDASRYEWCVHHIDHDRTNNVIENFEMLCKRCHQVEHDCHLAFFK